MYEAWKVYASDPTVEIEAFSDVDGEQVPAINTVTLRLKSSQCREAVDYEMDLVLRNNRAK